MDIDMHYYGTYALAKAAGLTDEACKIIATAAEFVDDNAGHIDLNTKDKGHLHVTATAHHAADIANLANDDQQLVWVPFHFLPGAQGNSYEEKLQCVMDSPIAREMLEHHLTKADKSFATHLVGVAAHVYCDTFAHYGFSGISSKANYIDNDSISLDSELPEQTKSYIMGKLSGFRDKVLGDIAEDLCMGLGHGAAHTFPDRPYLKWSFNYEDGRASGERDNPATFLDACEKLHRYFIRYAQINPQVKATEPMPFSDIKDTVTSILNSPKTRDGRIKLWQGAAAAGILYTPGSEIPTYDANEWLDDLKSIEQMEDSSEVLTLDAYKFLQAAAVHRTYVLRELLPEHGLLVR